jgi:DNA-binding CsgD family transcriptional regulator/ketosteroid isomerase-like protein
LGYTAATQGRKLMETATSGLELEVVRQYLDSINEGDYESAEELIDEDFDYQPLPNNGWSPAGTRYYGREGWRTMLGHVGIPERGFRLEMELRAEGTRVIASGTASREEPDGSWTERVSGLLFTVSGGRIRALEGFPSEREAVEALSRLSDETTEARPQEGSLTPRQREIFRLLAEGLNGPEIAERLEISPDTVRTHVGNAMASLDAKTRAEAVATALRQGEISL